MNGPAASPFRNRVSGRLGGWLLAHMDLAGATPAYAREAMGHVREAAKYLQPE